MFFNTVFLFCIYNFIWIISLKTKNKKKKKEAPTAPFKARAYMRIYLLFVLFPRFIISVRDFYRASAFCYTPAPFGIIS